MGINLHTIGRETSQLTSFRSFHGCGWTTKLKFVKFNFHVKFLTGGTRPAMQILHVLRQSKLYCRHGTSGYTA